MINDLQLCMVSGYIIVDPDNNVLESNVLVLLYKEGQALQPSPSLIGFLRHEIMRVVGGGNSKSFKSAWL